MKYMLMFFDTAAQQAYAAETGPSSMAAWGAYAGAMGQAGVIVAGHGLQARHTATTVRVRDGLRQVQDGPFADTKEQLGGYFVIDVPSLDDALATALEKALRHWPASGVPAAPEAWLLAVARRELLQAARHQRLHDSPQVQAVLAGLADPMDAADPADLSGRPSTTTAASPALPDSRLKLLFVCAHPAIDAAMRPALMLQVVLGLPAEQIAQALLTSPAAMAQRLVRAKQKIRDAGLRFEEPGADDWPDRLHAVLEAIYAAYGLGWQAWESQQGDADEADAAPGQGLRAEALFLADLVCSLLPVDPRRAEAEGLLALILHCEARGPARRAAGGRFVPLAEQDTALWLQPLIAQGDQLLRHSAAWAAPGPFQIEAAIQSAHNQRAATGCTPWAGIVRLYDRLVALAPSLGAQVAQAVACAQAGDTLRASALLAALDHPRRLVYQPYWVARAHVAGLAGRAPEAAQDLQQAIGLTSDPAVRQHLLAQRQCWLAGTA